MRWAILAVAAMFWTLHLLDVAPTLKAETRLPNVSSAVSVGAENGGDVAGLKDTLEKGLRARVSDDFAFIAVVVSMVETNQLPRSMVTGTFNWVRKNRSHKKYMVPYFEQVLRSRAAQAGISIP
ncbi:MAG: hypothetical protein KDB14_34555 [Planctomycetales bacterium]|nr:hypothetical protein [Planctomycetales bacterium]